MSKSSKTFWAFMTGAAVGAALGILYAPDKGENTRSKLLFQLQKYRDQLQNLITDLIEGKEIPETMAKSEGKKVVNEAREKAERLLEDVENMMSQIKAKA
ncbi:YtxH domain-containing protein [Flectobacillus major]|jgi:gas vesicle protein|uniref:YtxH domain-containing protein n=1 Tax=Flectobacillus major TaxID=103 RepID=UPI0005C60219|nr:YtxH domain-containing protein [Flectobacillus major]